MNITPFVDRVSAIRISGKKPFRVVAGSADYSIAMKQGVALPAAYVYPLTEQRIGGQWANDPMERFEATVAVVIVAKNLRDARGAQALADLQALRNAVRDAFSQWRPDGFNEPPKFMRGALEAFDDQTLWWEDQYATIYYTRN